VRTPWRNPPSRTWDSSWRARRRGSPRAGRSRCSRAPRRSPGTLPRHSARRRTSSAAGPATTTFAFTLAPAAVEPALYDSAPKSFESFEQEWAQNESFLFELASIAAADYDPGAGTKLVEDYEGFWSSNEAFLFAFAPADLAAAPLEPFESGWRSNGTFLFAFAPANLSAAQYGSPAQPVEGFEASWPTVRMTTL
jgi:hypothetical protein